MNKQNFINFIISQGNIQLSDFMCERLNEFIAKLNDESVFTMIIQKIIHSKKRFINDGDLLEIIQDVLRLQAKEKAKQAKIKKYKGSRFEEEVLLTHFFYKSILQEKDLLWLA